MDSNPQSFIIKFWLEQTTLSQKNTLWHGQITHVPSGERRPFQDVDDLLNFIGPYLNAMGIQFTRQRRFWRWLEL
jgi:hypothetical protein